MNKLPLLAVALAVWVVAKVVIDRAFALDAVEQFSVNRNVAFGVFYGSFLVAAAIAISAGLVGRTESVWIGSGRVAVEGVWSVVLLWVSYVIHDRWLFHQFDLKKELGSDHNLGAAFCLAGSLLASGLVLNGAAIGFSHSWWSALIDITIYWALGQAILFVGVFFYRRITGYDLHQLITEDDNAAVGFGFGAFLLSVGIVVRSSLMGAGAISMGGEVGRTLLSAFVGMAGIALARMLVDLLMLPKADLNLEISVDRNMAAAILAGAVYIAVAVFFAFMLFR